MSTAVLLKEVLLSQECRFSFSKVYYSSIVFSFKMFIANVNFKQMALLCDRVIWARLLIDAVNNFSTRKPFTYEPETDMILQTLAIRLFSYLLASLLSISSCFWCPAVQLFHAKNLAFLLIIKIRQELYTTLPVMIILPSPASCVPSSCLWAGQLPFILLGKVLPQEHLLLSNLEFIFFNLSN